MIELWKENQMRFSLLVAIDTINNLKTSRCIGQSYTTMGLDIYFNKVKIESTISFRKVNFLLNHFGYTENCTYISVTKEQIEDLVKKCADILIKLDYTNFEDGKQVAELVALCKDTLPTQSGFFFGSTDYNGFYFDNIKEVYKAMVELIENTDFDTHEILMDCSW